jgi:TetR/AcrR family transcriptional regulator, transcriptional repressor of bet genes
MPRKVDAGARRQQIAEALWRVTRRDGWDAVSMRHVAAEAGVSVGMVQHYFTSKDQMLRFAMDMIGEDYGQQVARRIADLPEPREPRRVVEVILEELLPRDDRSHAYVQAAAAFLGRAVVHPDIATPLVAAGTRLTQYLADQIRRGRRVSDEAELDAAGLLALADGLIAHILTGRLTLNTAHEILARQLDRIFGPRGR